MNVVSFAMSCWGLLVAHASFIRVVKPRYYCIKQKAKRSVLVSTLGRIKHQGYQNELFIVCAITHYQEA